VASLNLDAQLCTACGLCARFCPTGALKFLSDGQSFALTFQPSFCLGKGCNACEIACPERAITTRPAVISAKILSQKSLIAGQLTACRVCRLAIASGPDLPVTCFACRQKSVLDDLLNALPL